MHHASTAQTGAATELGAGQLEVFPDHPQQRRCRRRIGRRRLAVPCECDGHGFPPLKYVAPREPTNRPVRSSPPAFLRASPYVSAALTRAGLSGRSRMRLPVALAKALATAATAGACEPSPAPSERS